MLCWHTCQICYPLEIKVIIIITTNFGWPTVQQVRALCFYFLSSSFLLLLIFSLFSNNATRRDLPNRQSINLRQINQSKNQSVTRQSVNQSIYNLWETRDLPPYLLVVMSKILSCNQSIYNLWETRDLPPYLLVVMSKILWACDTAFYAVICYNYIKHFVKFRVLQILILETNVRIVYYLFITQFQ